MRKVDHPNIVKVYDVFRAPTCIYIVMEFVEGEELFDFIKAKNGVSEQETIQIIRQLLKTLKYLNSMNLCHRDLKPENILIDRNTLGIKLLDFGLACYFHEGKYMTKRVGSPYYIAPEVLASKYGKE